MRDIEKLMFTKHVGVMLKSGITLAEAVEILGSQAKTKRFKTICNKLSMALRNGQSLAKAMEQFPRDFDVFYRSIVGIGEESGTLEQNLEYLATQLKEAYEFRRKVSGALLYPGLVVSVGFVVGGAVAVFVLPKLVDLFSSLDINLPLSTKILLWFASFMKQYGILVMVSIVLLGIGGWLMLRIRKIRYVWERAWLTVPVFGSLFEQVQLAMFCRNLGIMLRSGLPIAKALAITHESTEHLVFKGYVEKLKLGVEHGRPLEVELMSGGYKFMPLSAVRMIGVGERTGKLDESLMYLAEFYSEETSEVAKNLATILEPILLVVIALVVGTVAMAIISPIYQFTAGVGDAR